MVQRTLHHGIKSSNKPQAFRAAHRSWIEESDSRSSVLHSSGIQTPSPQLWKSRLGSQVAIADRRVLTYLRRGKPIPSRLPGGDRRAQPCVSMLVENENGTSGLYILSSKAGEWVPAYSGAGGYSLLPMLQEAKTLIVSQDVRRTLTLQGEQMSGSATPLPMVPVIGSLKRHSDFTPLFRDRDRVIFWEENPGPGFWELADAFGAEICTDPCLDCPTPAAVIRRILAKSRPLDPVTSHVRLSTEPQTENPELVLDIDQIITYTKILDREQKPVRLYRGKVRSFLRAWDFSESGPKFENRPVTWARSAVDLMGFEPPRIKNLTLANRVASRKLKSGDSIVAPGVPGLCPVTGDLLVPGTRFCLGRGAIDDQWSVHPSYSRINWIPDPPPVAEIKRSLDPDYLGAWSVAMALVHRWFFRPENPLEPQHLFFRRRAHAVGLAVCSEFGVPCSSTAIPDIRKTEARPAPDHVCDAAVALGQGLVISDEYESEFQAQTVLSILRWWLDIAFRERRVWPGMSVQSLINDLDLTLRGIGLEAPEGIRTRIRDPRSPDDGAQAMVRYLAWLVGNGHLVWSKSRPKRRELNAAGQRWLRLIKSQVFLGDHVLHWRLEPELPVADNRVHSLMTRAGVARTCTVDGVRGLLFTEDWTRRLSRALGPYAKDDDGIIFHNG